MTHSLADELQIWGFENGFTIFSDGSIGFGLRVVPLDVSCADDRGVDGLADRLGSFLNSMPSGVELQFVQEIVRGNSDVILKNQNMGTERLEDTCAALHLARIDRFLKEDTSGTIPKHGLLVFVRRDPTAKLIQRPSIFSKPKLFQKMAETTLERELSLSAHLKEDILRSFSALGLGVTDLSERDTAELIYSQWNPLRNQELHSYDSEDVRSSLLFTDVAISDAGFSLGAVHHRVISLKLLPAQTYASMARVLRNLPFDSKLFLSIRVPNQQKEIETLQLQRRVAFSMARGKRNGVSDIESEAKLEDLESLINDMVSQGEKVFFISLNVLLRADNQELLRDKVAHTLSVIRELSGAEGMEETIASFDIFSELAIPNARGKERAKRMKTSNVADLLPIYGPWTGHELPRILLKSRGGSLVAFDPFTKELPNYNQMVTGGSGSGKSFLTNLLLLQLLKENPKIFIVDIGGSYKKLCDNLSGQYIPFNITSQLSINPFDLIPGEEEPSSAKIKFLLGLVEMMTKEDGDRRLGRLEQSEIENLIQEIYKAPGSKTLSDLKDKLSSHNDPQIARLGKILSQWCGQTPFGKIVDRPTTLELHRSIVSFDLKGLESHPDLQAVCLYIITDYVWREVQKDRGSMKFLVFDECWKLLESDAGSVFIGEVFRTFRKYYASAIAISQNIDDFAKSKVASAILPNTAIKWVLMQKGADQARLKEVLRLNDNEMALIGSLHQERGIYSEAFLMAEGRHSVVAIEPTPLEYWIATTDPRDLAVFDKTLAARAGEASLEILKDLATKYPRGVVAGAGNE